MAIHNTSDLYTFGDVKINTQPSVNMYAQLLAKRDAQQKAQSEAFSNYVRDHQNKLNPDGIHESDREAFSSFVNDWANDTKTNGDAIKRNDVNAIMSNDALYNKALQLAAASKQKVVEAKPAMDVMSDPAKNILINRNVFIPSFDSHMSSFYKKDANGNYVQNKDRKPFNYKEDLFAPELDYNKLKTDWTKGVVPSETYGDITKRDKETASIWRNVTTTLTPDDLTTVKSNAVNSYDFNPKVQKAYQYKFDNLDPAHKDQLEKLVMPSGINSPKDLIQADALLEAKGLEKTKETKMDWAEQKHKWAQSNIYLNQSNGTGVTTAPGNAFDDFQDADYGKFYVKGGVWYNKDGTPKEGELFITGDTIPGTVRSALKAGGFNIDDLNRGVNGELKNGQLVSISHKKIGTITRQAMEGVYQPKMDTEPKGKTPLKFNDKNTLIKTTSNIPTYKTSDLIKAGWTNDQIKQAIKAGKIKAN